MNYRAIIVIGILSVLFVALLSCKNEDVSLVQDDEFCRNVNKHKYTELQANINSHLLNQDAGQEDALQLFMDYLNNKFCVQRAEIICDSCMESLPPKSIIEVVFTSDQESTTKRMHVSMGEHLEIVAIYEPR